MPDFYSKLRFQQSLLILLLALMLGFAVLGTFSLAVLICQGINGIAPVQEGTAWRTLFGLGLGSLVLALGGLLWLALKRPRPIDLARLVETRHPELQETLSTAMEIQERGGPANALEEALFRDVDAKCAEINLKRDSLPRLVHPASVLLLIAVAMVLSDFAGKTDFVAKARFYQIDRMQGEATGLLVQPGDADVPRADDLTITAEVTRWENDPVIVYEQNGVTERFPMTVQAAGPASFTLFGVTEPLRYRVETSSLSTPWYAVTVYDPPRIDTLELSVTPPAYTREEPTEFSRLVDLHAPEDSEVSLMLTTQIDVTGSLRVSGERLPMEKMKGNLAGSFVMQSDGDYQVVLKNTEGRLLVTPSFDLDVIPDEAPTVEITEPGEDKKAKPEGAVPFSVFAGDDYGLSKVELHVSVSGLPRNPLVLFEAGEEPTPEAELYGAIEIASQNAEHGDIITYYAVAWDNREPEPQSARSDVFFIEVLTDIPDQEGGESEGQGEGEREEINLRGIIVELKRLMRMAHAAIPQTGERREEAMQELATGIAEARKETSVALEKLTMMFMQMAMMGNEDGRAMADLLVVAMENMVEAELLANQDEPDKVNPTLAEALSNLLIVESFANSQPQMQASSGGQGQPSEGQAKSSGEQQQQGQSKESQEMSMSDLQESLENLNRLLGEQAALNGDYNRADGQNLSEAEQSELLGKQVEIDNEVGILSKQLRSGMQEQTYELRNALKESQNFMRKASGATQQGEYGSAERSGLRAQSELSAAQGMLGELIRETATGALAGLSQQAGDLASRQEAARQASEAASGNSPGEDAAREMRQQQDAMREELEQLIAEMQREAVNLEQTYTEAGEALGQAARNARRANTTGEMQRATNSLLYERYARAERHQGEAARQLEELQASLDAAMEQLSAMSPSQLRNLSEQISQAQQALAQSKPEGQQSGEQSAGQQPGGEQSSETEGELAPSLRRLGQELSRAGKALSDEQLVELGQNLEASKEGDGGGLTRARLAPSLDQAARIIHQYLRGELIGERLRMNRDSAPPPEQYRRLVEEYFKNLAEEQ